MSETTTATTTEAGATAGTGATEGAATTTATAAAATASRGPTLADIAGEDVITTGEDGKPVMPDWLPGEQFWDKEKGEPRVAELAKSWKDLRGQLSRAGQKAEAPPEKPDAYALPQVEGIPADFFQPDDPLLPAVKAAAHAAGVSQKQFEAIAKPYLEVVAQRMKGADPKALEEADRAAYQTELAKLGPDGKAVARQAFTWVTGLKDRGILTDDEAFALQVVGTAPGVRALLKLQQMAGGPPIPMDAIADASASEGDARALLAEGYAKNDPDKIAKGNRILGDLIKKGVLPARVG